MEEIIDDQELLVAIREAEEVEPMEPEEEEEEVEGQPRVPVPEKVAPASGCRRWCFTIHDYNREEEYDDELGFWAPVGRPTAYILARSDKTITAFVCGEEVCPDTGRAHLQGYFETGNRPQTLEQLLRNRPFLKAEKDRHHSVHLTPANGTAEENKAYCRKADRDGECWGIFSKSREGQGKRNDWAIVRELAEQKAPVHVFFEQAPHLTMPHHAKIAGWVSVYTEKVVRTWKTIPKIFLGPPRVGKSTLMRAQAHELAEANGWRIYVKSDSEDWWPDYDGEEIILIDEAHGGFWQWQQLLRFFEEGSYTVRQKYNPRRVELLARVVFMTTNTHPALWYKAKSWDETNAFRARIEEFGELWTFRKRNPIEIASKIYPPPTRDIELASPPELGANGVSGQLSAGYGQPAGWGSPWGNDRMDQ